MENFIVNGKDVNVVYKTDYFGRYLYLLEIDGKIAQVYRSSGFSGTGHKGKFLPFLGLSDRETFSQCLGYIFKEMFYNGGYLGHYKDVSWSDEITDFLDQLPLFLKDESAEIPNDISVDDFAKQVATTIAEMQIIKNKYENGEERPHFDWSTLENEPRNVNSLSYELRNGIRW